MKKMRRIFGSRKEKAPPPPSVEEASEKINKRGDVINDKIKTLDAELCRYREQIKKTKPGPSQEVIKARAMRVIKQKKMYEGQRNMLYNQAFSLDQVSFASEGIKNAQQTMEAMKVASKELSGTLKTLKIDDVDKMQDEMMDLVGYGSEIQESLVQSYSVPDDLDEEEVMGELGSLEADMVSEIHNDHIPTYLQPDKVLHNEEKLELPSAPVGNGMSTSQYDTQDVDEHDVSTAPKVSSIRS